MSKSVLLLINGVTYEASPWPAGMPNPGKNKFLVYRNGVFVGTSKTKKDFESRIHAGYWDACVEAVEANT